MTGKENIDRFTPVDELRRWYFVCEGCDAQVLFDAAEMQIVHAAHGYDGLANKLFRPSC